MTAGELIKALELTPHPEGGHFRETFRDAASTAIYYLLKAGERSHWHRVDKAEVWHFYAGEPLELALSHDGKSATRMTLGPNIAAGQHPQIVVPANAWQSARPLGRFTLVGCTVAPAFTFEGFEMAPPGWEPG